MQAKFLWRKPLLDYAAMKLWTPIPLIVVLVIASAFAQDVISLSSGVTAQSPEKQYFSKSWNTEVIANVTQPSMLLFKPAPGTSNGTAVIVVPGGGFMALSINSEGFDLAKWLTARGVTAFVLKYRLKHTGEDAPQEFSTSFKDEDQWAKQVGDVITKAIDDGLTAVAYVRKHAPEWGIAPDRVGIIGFSAGGTITAGVGLRYAPESRPAFVAPIYPAMATLKDLPVRADAPPIFLVAASDDGLGLAPDSVFLYDEWTAAHKSAELHMYAKGNHGFGMRKQGLPSDGWVDRFGEWMQAQGWMKSDLSRGAHER
jgi:acetyl esterase/lipase